MYGQGGAPRPSMGGDFDGRPHSNSGLQNYYQNQRGGYGSHRSNQGGEQAQMEQAKRRMAAQRERELRNYHQEQQYAKSITTSGNNSGPKSDRSMSPNTGMSEDERRELIARQHRALYGNDSNLYEGKNAGSRPASGDARNMGPLGGRGGGSPLAFDPYGQGAPQGAVQMPPRGGDDKDASGSASHSPANNQNPTFDNARTSNSSPTGGSPPGSKGSGAGVIGSRPQGSQAPIQGLQKRSTTPLPSPLSYGYSANDQSANERSTSASSQDKGNVGLGWGNSSGVWGNQKSGLGVQASVWG